MDRCYRSHLANVVLHRKLAAPQRQAWPSFAKDGMIGHGRVDVVLDPGFLRGIGQSFSDGHLVAPGDCVDEGASSSEEQGGDELLIFQGALDEFNVLELAKLFGYRTILFAELGGDVGADIVAYGRGNAGEGSTLASGGVDDDEGLVGHEKAMELKDLGMMTCSSSNKDARDTMGDKDRTGFSTWRDIEQECTGKSRGVV